MGEALMEAACVGETLLGEPFLGAAGAARQATGLSTRAEAQIAAGDLTDLTPEERVTWYKMRCDAAGLDWRTAPFQYLCLNGKLILYATKTASEQAAETRGITLRITARERLDGLFVVTCRAIDKTGRGTDSIGAVPIENLRGDALANALMKAETKAKRRAVLALCGLGMMDETETETLPGANALPLGEAHSVSNPLPFQEARSTPSALSLQAAPANPLQIVDTATGESGDSKAALDAARRGFETALFRLGIYGLAPKERTAAVRAITMRSTPVANDIQAWNEATAILTAFRSAHPAATTRNIEGAALRKFGDIPLCRLNKLQWQTLTTDGVQTLVAPPDPAKLYAAHMGEDSDTDDNASRRHGDDANESRHDADNDNEGSRNTDRNGNDRDNRAGAGDSSASPAGEAPA